MTLAIDFHAIAFVILASLAILGALGCVFSRELHTRYFP